AILREALLQLRRFRFGEAALELDELAPRNRWLAARNASAAHASLVVDRLRRADEHLLRIAATQMAGAAERQMIDHRHPPSFRTTSPSRDLSRRSSSDRHKIVCRGHVSRLPVRATYRLELPPE